MARTREGTRLTDQHRRVQAAIATQVLRRVAALWPLLDLTRLDDTSSAWVAATMEPVRAGHTLSVQAALAYLRAYRAAEGARTLLGDFEVPQMDTAAVQTSLIVTGPVMVKKATANGVPLEVSARNALTMVSGAVQRHVLEGGRGAVTTGVQVDPVALGWARIATPDACAFCTMLASRGPEYLSEYTAGFQPHDNCWCQPEPVYEGYEWRDENLEAREQWESLRPENGGPGASLNNLRRLRDGRLDAPAPGGSG